MRPAKQGLFLYIFFLIVSSCVEFHQKSTKEMFTQEITRILPKLSYFGKIWNVMTGTWLLVPWANTVLLLSFGVKPTLGWATTGSVPSLCSLLNCLWDWVDNGQVVWGEFIQLVNNEFLRFIFPNIVYKVSYEIAMKYKALFSIAPPLKR